MTRRTIVGAFAAVAAMRGANLDLARYRGKVVLLNFRATWCHGCVQEIPWFIEFQQRYKPDGLQVIGVAMDDDGWTKVRPYMKKTGVNYPVVIGSEDLGKQFGLGEMPMTILFGRDGKIASTHKGVVDRAACEGEIRTRLEAR